MLKSFASFVLSLIFLLALNSCSQANKSNERAETTTEESADAGELPYSPKSAEEVEIVEAEDIDGNTERYFRRKSDFAKDGKYVKYGPKGQKLVEAYYVNDTLHLYRILYYEKGDTQIVETYNMGEFDGPFKSYYENGQLELLGIYNDNVATGQWKKYYNTGELMEVVTFADNQENGPFVEYYQNGNLKAEGNYLNGSNEHGELKLYDEAGVLIKRMDCEKGICKTVWKVDDESI